MGSKPQHPLNPFQRMPMAFTIWKAMSGSGVLTSTGQITISTVPKIIPRDQRTLTTPRNPGPSNAYNAVALSSATINIANAIKPAAAAKEKLTHQLTMWGLGVSRVVFSREYLVFRLYVCQKRSEKLISDLLLVFFSLNSKF